MVSIIIVYIVGDFTKNLRVLLLKPPKVKNLSAVKSIFVITVIALSVILTGCGESKDNATSLSQAATQQPASQAAETSPSIAAAVGNDDGEAPTKSAEAVQKATEAVSVQQNAESKPKAAEKTEAEDQTAQDDDDQDSDSDPIVIIKSKDDDQEDNDNAEVSFNDL